VIHFRICFAYSHFLTNNIRFKTLCRKLQFYLASMGLKFSSYPRGKTHTVIKNEVVVRISGRNIACEGANLAQLAQDRVQ
jgi:hypothetical protein